MHRIAEQKNNAILKEIVTEWGTINYDQVKKKIMANSNNPLNANNYHFTFGNMSKNFKNV